MEKPHILLVDDDPLACRAVKRLLEGNGMQVSCVQNGEAAIANLGSLYSLVLLDLSLDIINGFDVLKCIREKDAALPVIILSGNQEDGVKVHSLGLGVDNYIEKSFLPHVMLSQVKAMLRFSQRENHAEPEGTEQGLWYDILEDCVYQGKSPFL